MKCSKNAQISNTGQLFKKKKKGESWTLKRSSWPCPKNGEYIQTSMKISICKQRIILFTAFLKKPRNTPGWKGDRACYWCYCACGDEGGGISTKSETGGLNTPVCRRGVTPVTAPGSSTKEQRTSHEPANAQVGNGRSLPIQTPQFWGTRGGEVLGRGRVSFFTDLASWDSSITIWILILSTAFQH